MTRNSAREQIAACRCPLLRLNHLGEMILAEPPVSASGLYAQKLKTIRRDLRDEYLAPHNHPWIIGFSGGKDSTLLNVSP